jgi:hypothetical protein
MATLIVDGHSKGLSQTQAPTPPQKYLVTVSPADQLLNSSSITVGLTCLKVNLMVFR